MSTFLLGVHVLTARCQLSSALCTSLLAVFRPAMKIDFSKWLAFLLQDFKLISNQPKLISKTKKMPNRSLSSHIHNRTGYSINECNAKVSHVLQSRTEFTANFASNFYDTWIAISLVHAGRPFLSQSNSSLRPYHLSSRSRFLHWCFVLPCLLSECHLPILQLKYTPKKKANSGQSATRL